MGPFLSTETARHWSYADSSRDISKRESIRVLNKDNLSALYVQEAGVQREVLICRGIFEITVISQKSVA